MAMFTINPSHLSLSFVLGLSLSLSACQILPKQPHLPESEALSARVNALYQDNGTQARANPPVESQQQQADTIEVAATTNADLVAAISEQNEIHPDLSGYHPIVTGANAFASRSILTDMATRNIDAQYYIWHDDQAGQLMLKDLWEAAERGVIVRLLLDDFNYYKKCGQGFKLRSYGWLATG